MSRDPAQCPTQPLAQQPAESSAPETRWLSEQEQTAWRSFLRGTWLLNAVLDDDMQEHGHSLSEYEILAMLSEALPDGLRMSALADLVVQSRSRLSHTALRLERRKLVRRRPTPGDGRGVELSLTPAGLEVVERLAPAHVASVRAHLIDVLTPVQLAELGHAMAIVRAAILDLDPDDPTPIG